MRVAIGFITHGQTTGKYLPDFVASLRGQSYQDFNILAWDNSPAGDEFNRDWLKQNLPEAEVKGAGANLGFAKAANRLLAWARATGAEYFWLINPDTYLDQAALAELIAAMDARPEAAAASPKVLRWDFINKAKTKIIDTCGLALKPGFKFVDVGQGEFDRGQYDHADILGPSGASAFFRLANLGAIKFDERFFMYKEDCDLVYQLFLAGEKAIVASRAVIYHDRTITRGARSAKSRQSKQWSFYGQQLLLKKYWPYQNFWSKALIVWREIFMLLYVLVFEPYLLAELAKIKKLKI